MNCEKYLNLIDDLVEGELESEAAKQVNLHIFACPACELQYKRLKAEKQNYGRYLFNVEPSGDLWKSLRQKIELEPEPVTKKTFPGIFVWGKDIFSFFRLNTAFAAIAILVICGLGFGVWQFAKSNSANVAEAGFDGSKFGFPSESPENKDLATAPPNKFFEKNPLPEKSIGQNIARVVLKDKKSAIAVLTAEKLKNRPASKRENPSAAPRLKEEQVLSAAQAQLLEKEADKQVEKIELLLRSFRNARITEGSDSFDVSYEKQQARKLLERNVQLRQTASNYGNLYTAEILDKAEGFLLDIANLENNPSPEKVINIKERVKNQNIIASLQVY